MKHFYAALLLLSSFAGFSQIPAGYYDNATGTGYTLKTQLKTIVTNGHNPQTYNPGLWNFYNSSVRDHFYENDGSLLDIYSENPAGADPYNFTSTSDQCGNYSTEGDCYNKEHLIPQSYFGDGEMPMFSDAHQVVPTDGKVNGWRDNLPFGVVYVDAANTCNGGATNTPCHSANGSKLGNNFNSGYSAGYSGKVFEPIDEFKGDIARSFFYFATRYEDQMAGFYTNADASSTQAKAMFDGTNDKVFSATFLNILLTWHLMDPVSAKETEINNAVYGFQNNRNPYIDHPEYVEIVWGTPLAVSDVDVLKAATVYPNPADNHLVNISSEKTLDRIELINLNGQLMMKIDHPVRDNDDIYTLQNLPEGFYLLKLTSGSASSVKKIVVN